MDILNFLSFGTWDVIVVPAKLESIQVAFYILLGMTIIKGLVICSEFFSELPNKYTGFYSSLVGVLSIFVYVFLYTTPLFIFAAFHSISLLFGCFFVLMLLHVIGGMYYVIEEGKNLFYFDEKFLDFLSNSVIFPMCSNFIKRDAVKRINKRIYEYRKTSI